MRNKYLLILFSALFSIGMAIFFRGSVLHTVVVLMVCIYLGLPFLILAIVTYLLRNKFPIAKKILRSVALLLIVISSLVVSLIAGLALGNHDMTAAKTYCESLIPSIEMYKKEHGTYPSDISTIANDNDIPRLLRKEDFYWSDGQGYGFNFSDPQAIMRGVGYSSDSQQWQDWD